MASVNTVQATKNSESVKDIAGGNKVKPFLYNQVVRSCTAEMKQTESLPLAFTLAEPIMDPGTQMPTASYTFGLHANSYKDWDA